MTCIVSGRLATTRLADGRRELLEPLEVEAGDYLIRVEQGFVTDFSSIPTLLPIVRWSKVDVAGVVHDMLFRPRGLGSIFRLSDAERATNLIDEIKIGTADTIWKQIARSGEHRAGAVGAGLCRVGLYGFGWPVWNRYRSDPDRKIPLLKGLWRCLVGTVVATLLLLAIALVLCVALHLLPGPVESVLGWLAMEWGQALFKSVC